MERIVPEVPAPDKKLRLLIDTDAANEIDDLYAIALAIKVPERFELEGLVATQFNQYGKGPESIQESYDLILELLAAADATGKYRVEKGGDPMQYQSVPIDSDGARFIVERAHAGSAENPLWLVGLGAASNIASALRMDPSICSKIRLVYHARSEWSWPERSDQFNVGGDVNAVRSMLHTDVPLVWFDTGTQLTISMEETEKRLKPLGPLGEFLHEFRRTRDYFMSDTKGFFDLGDIAWLMDTSVCTNETVDVPDMDHKMKFKHTGDLGRMLRVHSCKKEPVWEMFFERLKG